MAEERECMDTNLYKAAQQPSTVIPVDVNRPRFLYRSADDFMNGLTEITRESIVKARDNRGRTVVHYAVEENRLPMVEMLLTAHSSLGYLRDNDGLTPLHIASSKGLFPMVTTILEFPPQALDSCDNNGKTVLHAAAEMDVDFVRQCLEKTAMRCLVNEVDNDGNTPLHVALMKGADCSAFELLMAGKYIWTFKNNEGYSPLDICKSSGIPYMSKVYYALRYLDGCGQRELTRYKLDRSWRIAKMRDIFRVNLEWMEEMQLQRLHDKVGIVAAVLLATSWALTTWVPGGYNSETGRPFLMKGAAAYNTFIFLRTLAFLASGMVLMTYTLAISKKGNKRNLVRTSIYGLQFIIVLVTMAVLLSFVCFCKCAFVSACF